MGGLLEEAALERGAELATANEVGWAFQSGGSERMGRGMLGNNNKQGPGCLDPRKHVVRGSCSVGDNSTFSPLFKRIK